MKSISKYHSPWLLAIIMLSLLIFPLKGRAQDPAPFEITLETIYDALPGSPVTLDILCDNAAEDVAAFDFSIKVESAYHIFVDVQPGDFINRCGWQYFTYRYHEAVDIGTDTPVGLVRIIAAAESNTGSPPPDCFLPNAGESLVQLTLRLREGCKYRCLQVPVQFIWTGCYDNSLTLRSAGTRAISRRVFDHFDQEITDTACTFPAFGGAPNCCIDNTPFPAERLVDFHDGRIDAVCPDDTCMDRGDINCNGVPYEAADIVFMSRMFIILFGNPIGPHDWDDCSIINSDVNADDITLSVADFVYLIRVVIGDLFAYPKPNPTIRVMEIYSHQTAYGTEIRYRSPIDIGGLLVQFEGVKSPDKPSLGRQISDMEVEYVFGADRAGALIYDKEGDIIPAGEGVLFTFPGDNPPIISEIDASDWSGQILNVKIQSLPDRFEVGQNRPNPFNLSTTITLSLPSSSPWRIEVFNIIGQRVRELSGYDNAGIVSVTWDGRDESGKPLTSGIYFYRATVGDQSETRKMSLLK